MIIRDRECDECGWKAGQDWTSERCGSLPFGSCDGTVPEPACEHGNALDVHCCGCRRSGFFPPDDCDCYPYDDEEAIEDEFDCHRGTDGSCELAGSEECEFECPYRSRL